MKGFVLSGPLFVFGFLLSASSAFALDQVVAWDSPLLGDDTPALTAYRMYWSDTGADNLQQLENAGSLPISQNQLLLTNLQPGTTYHLAVSAVYSGSQESEPSNILTFTTAGDAEDGSSDDGIGVVPHDQDSDSDGVSDLQERIDGTDAGDSTSFREPLLTRVCGEWNGFLGMFNFFEHVNLSSNTLEVGITLYDLAGQAVGADTFNIEPGAQFDYPVNSLSGFAANTFGLVCSTHNGQAGEMDGRMVFYKPGDAGSFQFAFASPMSNGLKGSQYVGFNTFQPSFVPSDQGNLVANWLQVTNLEDTEQEADLIFYDFSGAVIGENSLVLAPGARVDTSGHQFGASLVGLVELRPTSENARMIFRNIRYLYDNAGGSNSFDAAFQLEGAKGGTGQQVIPVDTRGASSIVELMNTSSTEVVTTVTLREANGELVQSYEMVIGAKGSFHLITDLDLGLGKRGVVTVNSDTDGALLAVVMNYSRDASNGIDFMYGLRADSGSFESQSGSYNTFIGQESELLVINHGLSSEAVSVEMVDFTGRVDMPVTDFSVSSLGSTGIVANDSVPVNTYGVVTTDSDAEKTSAWILRKRGNEYLIPTPVRPKAF